MSRRPARPTGFTVVETLVALLLTFLLGSLALATLSAQRRAQAALTRSTEVVSGLRTARHILGREARAAGTGQGGWVVASDTFGLRAFRGFATVCPYGGDGDVLTVQATGWRTAREEGDSVLVLLAEGAPEVRALVSAVAAVSAGSDGCAGDADPWERWTLSAPVPGGAILLRYFSRVSFHLSDGALRLRSGAGGRQPLTPDVLDGRTSGFAPADGGVEVHMVPSVGGSPGWTLFLAGGEGDG